MSKIVVIGSCSVDFTTYAPRLPNPGETLIGTKFTTSYGGKGANQCVAAAKLGGNSFMICRLGLDQWGEKYKKNFDQLGVDTTYVALTPDVTTGIAQISVADNGENQIVIVPGANSYLSKDDVKNAEQLITNADILIGQLETPLETTLEAFKLNKGIKLLNAAPARRGIEEILLYCTILCVNEPEAALLTNTDVSLKNAVAVLKKLLETGCESVIITLGPDGAVYMSKHDQEPIHIICDNVTPVDTTGAGDAFVGAFATYLVTHKDKPMHQIIGAACHVASLSVTKEGTQTSYPSKFDAFKRVYKYKKL
ncbi:ribokinase-like isoform X1 [Helicoverpa zea]|uniref:ribokinase-like isoform X1 n=2 Tax=Helicoverpa zea TaxID=7113 RepID=UPI001F59675D|nr:ribokinase-like isoform X1 [Helicoverpa zea]